MTDDIPGVAERLAREFADLPPKVVMEAVCSCAGECESASPFFMEQAARASLHGWGHGPVVPEQPTALEPDIVPEQPTIPEPPTIPEQRT